MVLINTNNYGLNKKPVLGVFYWHNPTRLGNLELVKNIRNIFFIILISNEYIPHILGYCDDLIVENFEIPERVIDKLKKIKNKYGLNGLITLSEGSVTLLADCTEALGLIGNFPDVSRRARNKYRMREYLRNFNVRQPKFFRAFSLSEAVSIFNNHFYGKSCFLKPPCIGGSSFCSRIDTIDELKLTWTDFFESSKNRTRKDPLYNEEFQDEMYYMLMEEMMGGCRFDYDDILAPNYPIFEVSVEGFIDGDKTTIYSITDKLLPLNAKYGEEHMWRMHSRLPNVIKSVLKDCVNKINKSIGAKVGCSHTEFRVEKVSKDLSDVEFDGDFYRVRLIETALRPGGAFMQSAIQLATGFNAIRAMAFQACGLETNEQVIYRIPCIMMNIWAPKSGKIKKIEGLDKILSYKHNLGFIHLYDGIGDYTQVPPRANRGMADILIYDTTIDLLTINNWEILGENQNIYRQLELIYMDILDKFIVTV